MPRARLLAVATSALLGIVAGVATGVLLDRTDAGSDPLGLGVPQVNQPCTGKTLLVVARGDGADQLGSAVATEGQGVRYLDTQASCNTAWDDPGVTSRRLRGPIASSSLAAHMGASGAFLIVGG